MRFTRKAVAATLATALVSTSITPAFAGGYGSFGIGSGWGNSWGSVGVSNAWGGGRRHRGHRDDDDTGNVLAGVLIGAVLTGVIVSASKKKKERERARTYPSTGDQRWESSSNDDTRRGDIASEDQAVDACAQAAEGKAGRTSSVRDITQVSKSGDGWDVEGIVESRDNWRDRSTEQRDFTCSVRYGAVDSVYLEDPKVALR